MSHRPPASPAAALVLPCTGQALRLALAQRDMRTLEALTRSLRVAGYRFDPLALAEALLVHGCAAVADRFGHRVPVHVRVPARAVPGPSPAATAGRAFAISC